jgi:lysophospholipase L1-like esterase
MRSAHAAGRLGAGLLLLGIAALGIGRRELVDLPAEDASRSVRRFLLGPADVDVTPGVPWARVPAWLPGRADQWAGGSTHAIVVRAEVPTPRALRLYVQTSSASPRALQDFPAPADASPARLRIVVNGRSAATVEAPPTGGSPGQGPGRAPRLIKVEIPASALGGETPVRVAVVNDGGPGVGLRRIRLVEALPSVSLDRLGQGGRLPAVSAVLLAAGLGLVLSGRLVRPGGDDGGIRWRRALGPALGLLLLGLAVAAPAATRGVPRAAWVLLILGLLPMGKGGAGPAAAPRAPAARLAHAAGNGLLVVASLAASLVVGELALRAAFGGEPWARRALGTARARPRTEHLNSLGFDEREFPLAKPSGTYRIAVLGDSLSVSVGRAERFGSVVADRLNARAPRPLTYEALNFGRTGVDTIHETEILRRFAWRANPDFVLLQWYVNDIENGSYGERPDHYDLIPGEAGPAAWLRRLTDRTLFHWMLERQLPAVQERLGLVETYPAYIHRLFGDPASRHWEAAASELRAFIAECRAHRTPVAIVLFPHLSAGLAAGAYEFAEIHEQVLDLCRRESVPCVDLRSTFAPHRDHMSLWLHRFDAHPNALAHRLAGERLAEVLGPLWLEAGAARAVPAAATSGPHASRGAAAFRDRPAR